MSLNPLLDPDPLMIAAIVDRLARADPTAAHFCRSLTEAAEAGWRQAIITSTHQTQREG